MLFILVILRLFTIKEGFVSQTTNDYNKFKQFYNQFITNWTKAIVSSIAIDTPQEPLTSPGQVSQPPNPSQNDMNLYIDTLSKNLNTPLPHITDLFPEIDTSLTDIISRIPPDSTPYVNALKWMNDQMEKAHSNLNIDNFEDMCQDISSCIANNPDLIAKIAESQANNEKDQIKKNEQELSNRIAIFFSNNLLQPLIQKNTELVTKTEDVQKQAESGQLTDTLTKQFNTPETKYDIPKGGNALAELQKTDPEKYNKIKDVAPKLFSIKQLIEQINATL